MMLATMRPVSAELAAMGRCWRCKQWFVDDDYCFELLLGEQSAVWLTCLGCVALLVCHPV